MTSSPRTSKKKFVFAGIVSGLLGAGGMALYDHYNQQSFSIWKFVMFFLIIGILNSYLQYLAQRNVDRNEEHKFKAH